jgi:hypothetical protein
MFNVVKWSGGNKPIWVAKHKCMEETQGISLYSYLYPKFAKTKNNLSFLLSFMVSSTSQRKEGRASLMGNREGWGKGREDLAQIICTHVSKCKNDKIKEEKK